MGWDGMDGLGSLCWVIIWAPHCSAKNVSEISLGLGKKSRIGIGQNFSPVTQCPKPPLSIIFEPPQSACFSIAHVGSFWVFVYVFVWKSVFWKDKFYFIDFAVSQILNAFSCLIYRGRNATELLYDASVLAMMIIWWCLGVLGRNTPVFVFVFVFGFVWKSVFCLIYWGRNATELLYDDA